MVKSLIPVRHIYSFLICWLLLDSLIHVRLLVFYLQSSMFILDKRKKTLTAGAPDVTEVCMDEGAVSSNALVSILLDGGLVKDWCKRTFYKVALTLRDICILVPFSADFISMRFVSCPLCLHIILTDHVVSSWSELRVSLPELCKLMWASLSRHMA